jgi:hypothetical protein
MQVNFVDFILVSPAPNGAAMSLGVGILRLVGAIHEAQVRMAFWGRWRMNSVTHQPYCLNAWWNFDLARYGA